MPLPLSALRVMRDSKRVFQLKSAEAPGGMPKLRMMVAPMRLMGGSLASVALSPAGTNDSTLGSSRSAKRGACAASAKTFMSSPLLWCSGLVRWKHSPSWPGRWARWSMASTT